MSTLLAVLLLITAMFILGVLLKNSFARRLCALCASISGSWIILLTLTKVGRFHDPVLLAILLGQSVTGVFYLVRRHIPDVMKLFTLPFFLSLTILAYWVVGGQLAVLPALGFLLVLWLVAYVLFVSRQDSGRKVARAVMECCEDEK